jgi:DNA topoisomerase-3
VFEFFGTIFGKPAKIKVTSVLGHVLCRDFPKQYADWYQTDPEQLFKAETLKREVLAV